MKNIIVEPGVKPKCPDCGETCWDVVQIIRRRSALIGVDSLNDLKVGDYDIANYEQQLVMHCIECGGDFSPSYGISASAERPAEHPGITLEVDIPMIEAYQERGESGENIHAWSTRVENSDDIEE